jgi:hypothetical protein
MRLGGDPHDRAWVARTLHDMAGLDQLVRGDLGWAADAHVSDAEADYFLRYAYSLMADVDGRNTAELRRIVAVQPWFSASEWGPEPGHDAWLLVQHADKDPYFQREILDRVAPLVETGEVGKGDYALLFDRVALAEGKPQRYGSTARTTRRIRAVPVMCRHGARTCGPPKNASRFEDRRRIASC